MKQKYTFATFGKQIVYTIAVNIIVMLLSVVQVPIITKSLGTSLYGTWSLISVAISLITPIAMLSFGVSIIRFLAAEKDPAIIREDFYSALTLVFILGSVFSIIIFLLSGLIATYFFRDSTYSTFVRLSSILILENSLFPVMLAFFRRGTKIGIFNILNLGLNILQVTLIIMFTLKGYSLKGVIIATIIASAVLNLISLAIIFKEIGFQWPKFLNMKPYLKWGIPLVPNAAIFWVIATSDRYIVSYFLGVSEAGIYSAAYAIGAYASFALLPIGIVLYPNISRTYDEGKLEECRNFLEYSFRYLMMITIPAAAGLSILAQPLLKLLTTSDFISGSIVVPLIAAGAVVSCFYQVGIYTVQLVGKTSINIKLLLVAAFLNVLLNLLFVPHMGIIGSGLASLISYAALGALTRIVTRNYLVYGLNPVFLLKSLFASGIMTLCIWLLKPNTLIMVFVSIGIGIVVYFAMLLMLKAFSKSEIDYLKAFIQNFPHLKTKENK